MQFFARLAAATAALVIFFSTMAFAETVRVGVLKFGTVNWELSALKTHKLDDEHGFDLEIVPFASEDATTVALQGGAVDIIVSDWLWVSRQRALGGDLAFAPYSSSVGAIMIPPDSPMQSLADLKGKKLGVAGGPLDKSWLLLQGWAKRDFGIDLAAENDIAYGAPPLLAEKAQQGELDAVLNFWHFAARLEAAGFRRLASAEQAAQALGAKGAVSAIGYIFSEKWADEHPQAAKGFLAASRDTKGILKTDDAEWDRLQAAGVIKDEGAALLALRDRYREGIPSRQIADEEEDAAHLYAVLAELGGEKLVGESPTMQPGTYWTKLKNGF